jgi:hypothetical protein
MKWLNVGTQMILYWRRGGGEGFKKKKRGSRGCLFHAWLYDCMMGKERLRK